MNITKHFAMRKLLPLFFLLSLFLITFQVDARFSLTCQNITLNGFFLTASCARTDGTINNDVIVLTSHIGNNNGQLVWDSSDYHASCQTCFLDRDYPYTALICSCMKPNGRRVESAVLLDDRIANINGILTYMVDTGHDEM